QGLRVLGRLWGRGGGVGAQPAGANPGPASVRAAELARLRREIGCRQTLGLTRGRRPRAPEPGVR
ncbi:MAG: hypothetical protein AB1505_25275, partial [Candidatus Latescibacterota bacterium]